ncbi:hypothetical protein [Haloarchaeobius amylolyticus]|uniref:hypothetical protein n=1 Tax=Haloarchaeobius amylolyticus TaxID=1198296 RepID=UPI002272290D|nr:hypothetical protein [Haloarchaeobius amylolyticus]
MTDGLFGNRRRLLAQNARRNEDAVTHDDATSDTGFTPYTGDTGTADAGSADASASTASTKQRVERVRQKVEALIEGGRANGYDLAAQNLEDWLEETYANGTKTVPAAHFKTSPDIQQALVSEHRPKIVEGARKRLHGSVDEKFPKQRFDLLCGDMQVGPAPNTLKTTKPANVGRATLYWDESVTLSDELFYAFGGVTVHSEVELRAQLAGQDLADGWTVEVLSWTCQVCDRYNWDANKATLIPGFGNVSDAELKILEEHGQAAPYDVRSEEWSVSDPRVVGTFDVAGPPGATQESQSQGQQ